MILVLLDDRKSRSDLFSLVLKSLIDLGKVKHITFGCLFNKTCLRSASLPITK